MKYPKVLVWILFVTIAKINCSVIPLECEEAKSLTSDKLQSCTFNNVLQDSELDTINIEKDIYYEVQFINSSFTSIPSTVISEIPKLQTLKCIDCNIEELPPNGFSNARYLRRLLLPKNKIENIDGEAFNGAVDLGIIDLSENHIKSIDKTAFNNIKYLSFVNLSHNHIDFVESDLFKENHMLLNLDLSYNHLKDLEIQLVPIASIDASHNVIENLVLEQIESELNPYFSKMFIKIFMSHNKINHIQIDPKYKVRSLLLDHNEITNINDVTTNIPEYVEILDLSYNNLGLLSHQTFAGMNYLRNLYLIHGNIQLEDESIFSHLTNLTELDLSHNNLTEIPQNSFKNLNEIELIKLDGNNLMEFDVENLPEKIFALSLFNNNWQCDYLEQLFDKLRQHRKVHLPSTNFDYDHIGPNVNGVTCTE